MRRSNCTQRLEMGRIRDWSMMKRPKMMLVNARIFHLLRLFAKTVKCRWRDSNPHPG